jgi:O-antigen/teichoic acid export membrane protein
MLMNMAFVPFYMRFMGMEAYGLIGFYLALNSVLSLMDLGLSNTLNREMALLSSDPEKAQDARNTVRTLEVIYWPIALLIVLIVVGMASYLAEHWIQASQLSHATVHQAVVMMGISIALQWPYSLYEGGLLGLERQVLVNGIYSTFATLRGIGAVLLLKWVAPTIQVFFAWQIVVSAVLTLAVCCSLWHSLPKTGIEAVFDRRRLSSIWRFTAGMSGIALVTLILNQMDKIVLSRMLTLRMFGYYTLAFTIAGALLYGVTGFFTSLFPRFVQLWKEDDQAALTRLYHLSCQLVSVLMLPLVVAMCLYSRELILIWTGDATTAANTHLLASLLIVGAGCDVIMHLPYALQLAAGWTSLAFYKNLISLIIVAPLLLWAAGRYGGIGGASVYALRNIAYVLIVVPLTHRRLLRGEQWRWYALDIGLPLLTSLTVIGAGRLWIPMPTSRIGMAFWMGGLAMLAIGLAAMTAPAIRKGLWTRMKNRAAAQSFV